MYVQNNRHGFLNIYLTLILTKESIFFLLNNKLIRLYLDLFDKYLNKLNK